MRTILLVVCITASISAVAQNPTTPPEPYHHPQGNYVSVNGARLWYESEGSGEPLVLISGGPGFPHDYFHPFLSSLSKSFRVIYFDAFGRGKSDRAHDSREYTFDRDVEDVEGLRKALALGKITVLGHSYGGMVAEAYALRFPNSLHKVILADTLFSGEAWQANNDNSNNETRNQYPEVWEKIMKVREQGFHTCSKEYQAVADINPGFLYFRNPELFAKILENGQPANQEVYCSIVGDDADFLVGGDIVKLDFRSQLKNLQMPTLILAGRFDRVSFPRFSTQFKIYAPQAQFVMFEKSGHFPFVEQPEEFTQVVSEFLAK